MALRSKISLTLLAFILVGFVYLFVSSGENREMSIGALLKKSASERQERVRCSGFITVVDQNSKTIYLQDKTGAIRVRVAAFDGLPAPGNYVEVSGFFANSWPSPTIVNPSFKILPKPENAFYPQPVAASVADLKSGKQQYHLCRVRGVIRGVRSESSSLPVAELAVEQYRVDVRVPETDYLKLRDLTNAKVTLEGVADTGFDLTSQAVGVTLFPINQNYVQVEKPPVPVNAVPEMTIKQIFQPDFNELPEHQIRIHGTIVQDNSGTGFFISEEQHRLPIRTILENTLPVGVTVEAVGFLDRVHGVVSLDDAFLTERGESQDHPNTINTVQGIKRLPFALAALGIPVNLQGVVTYFEPTDKSLFVQDATGGIFVQLAYDFKTDLKLGQLVSVQGVTDPDDFATSIRKSKVTVIGFGKLPEDRVPDYDLVFSGAEDSNWVQLPGVVEAIDNSLSIPVAYIRAGKAKFRAYLAGKKPFPEYLVDSRISIAGVCGSTYNNLRQFLGIDMYVPDLSFIRIRESAVPVSQLPVLSIRKLLEYAPQSAIGHRVRVKGVVTSSSPQGPTTLQDASGSVTILDHNHSSLVPGDVAEAVGFLQIGELSPILERASVSASLGKGSIAPRIVIAEQILQQKLAATLVQLDAQLLDRAKTTSGEVLSFQSNGINFQAYNSAALPLAHFRPGSILRLTGVAVFDPVLNQNAIPSSFTLKLRSADDIQVLRNAPWLTFEKTLQVGFVITLIFGVSALWISLLRRQVKQQTAIIEEKLAREEALREEAEQFSRSKSEFLANMSHEIRTPMNGVLGMTELALNAEINPDVREYLAMAHSSGEQLLEILNDILDMSKIEAGHIRFESTSFSPVEIVTEVARTVAKRAQDKGLELIIDVEDSVPDLVVGDPHRLRQIILNLAGNAVKFTEKGEIVISAVAEEVDPATWLLQFKVKDTGIGVPADKTQQIFSAFTQADGSTTRKYGGTGLGLSICKQLAELMGGEIGLNSAVGLGSEFWFTAKLQKTSVQASDSLSLDPVPLKELRVLIVDDNATSRHILEKIVLSWGMRPTCAAGTAVALEATRKAWSKEQPFSMFLVDCEMPGQNGFTLVQALREEGLLGSDSSVLMLSPLNNSYAVQCRDLGLAQHLVKPVSRKVLLEAVVNNLTGAETKAPAVSAHNTENSVFLPALNILLAEDNRVNQIVARRFLERQGHHVTIVDNGAAAVKAVENGHFDVILMDVQMPEMDGYEATRCIRAMSSETRRQVPIIALTAHAMESDKTKCLAAGMSDFLTKPLQADALFEKLKGLAVAPV